MTDAPDTRIGDRRIMARVPCALFERFAAAARADDRTVSNALRRAMRRELALREIEHRSQVRDDE